MALYDILNSIAWTALIIAVTVSLGVMTWTVFNVCRYGLTCSTEKLHPEDLAPARFFGFVGTFIVSPLLLFATLKLPLFIFTYAFCPSSIEAPG